MPADTNLFAKLEREKAMAMGWAALRGGLLIIGASLVAAFLANPVAAIPAGVLVGGAWEWVKQNVLD